MSLVSLASNIYQPLIPTFKHSVSNEGKTQTGEANVSKMFHILSTTRPCGWTKLFKVDIHTYYLWLWLIFQNKYFLSHLNYPLINSLFAHSPIRSLCASGYPELELGAELMPAVPGAPGALKLSSEGYWKGNDTGTRPPIIPKPRGRAEWLLRRGEPAVDTWKMSEKEQLHCFNFTQKWKFIVSLTVFVSIKTDLWEVWRCGGRGQSSWSHPTISCFWALAGPPHYPLSLAVIGWDQSCRGWGSFVWVAANCWYQSFVQSIIKSIWLFLKIISQL